MWYGHFDGLITAIMRLSIIVYTLFSIAILKNNGYFFPVISKQTNQKINNFIAPFLLFMLGYWVLKFALSIKFINFDNTDIFFEVWIYFVIHVSIALIISLLLYYLIQKPDLLATVNKKIANFIENKDYSDYLKRLAFKLDVDKVYKNPDITLSSLSESLNINPRYLSTLINSNYNIGFTELINNHRLNESKTLLLNKKELTIQEIMYDVGFNSKSVFYSNFKKLTGVTPKEFREKFQVLEN
jgi:AraC-like DNA-binding protein